MQNKKPKIGVEHLVEWGREALLQEAESLHKTSQKISSTFAEACFVILNCIGKVVVSGVGKSGHIARKISSTLSSTGTSSVFLHPTEAIHGDFGLLQTSDVLIVIGFGGETQEILEVAKFGRRIGIPIIGIVGKADSSLARLSHYLLDGSIDREVCPLNLAPTTSSTVALALGDALSVCLMKARGFNESDFAAYHPGGSLGRKLSLVMDHMHFAERLPKLKKESDFKSVLTAVTQENFGIAAVVADDGTLIGSISDGDLRRVLLKSGAEALTMKAEQYMSKKPKTIHERALAIDALRLMESHQITRLFVVASVEHRKPVGLVRMQDLLAAKIM